MKGRSFTYLLDDSLEYRHILKNVTIRSLSIHLFFPLAPAERIMRGYPLKKPLS